MALRAARGCVLVAPSQVENSELERASGLLVVGDVGPNKVYRGVVEHVGTEVKEEIEAGDLVHYNVYNVIGEHHIVPQQHILAIGDD